MFRGQKKRMMSLCLFVSFLMAVGFVSAGWAADAYPSKPVTMQIHSAAGGSTDVGMRLLFKHVEKYLGKPVPVTNKPGAAGVVATTTLMRAKPDGYFIGSWISPTFASLMLDKQRNVGFTPADFTFIANHVYDPNIFCVKSDSPFKSLDDLVKAAKAEPGRISMAVTAKFGDDHLVVLDFQNKTGTKFNIVHFDSSAPARAAVLGGHAQVYVGNQGDSYNVVRQGDFRYLAFADTERSALFKDVPTMTELGIPVVGASARGIAGPKGLPRDVVAKLEEAIKKACENTEHIVEIEKMGFPLRFMDGKTYTQFLTEEYKRMEKLLN